MFNLETLLAPLFRYVRNATRQGLHQAFQAGAKDFTDDLAGLVQERQVTDHASLTRQLLLGTVTTDDAPVMAMPSAAQVTEADEPATVCPPDRLEAFQLAKRLMASGKSQRAAAEAAGIPDATLRGWLKKEAQG